MQKGFTIIEILITITVTVILVSMSAGAFNQFYKGNILEGETQKVMATITDARNQTLHSKNNTNYGIHFESDRVVLFKGSIYSAIDSDNEEVLLSSRVSLSTIILGGGNDIVYERLTGDVLARGTTTISLVSDLSQFKELVITKTGIVEW